MALDQGFLLLGQRSLLVLDFCYIVSIYSFNNLNNLTLAPWQSIGLLLIGQPWDLSLATET